jgi:hypothetical protein
VVFRLAADWNNRIAKLSLVYRDLYRAQIYNQGKTVKSQMMKPVRPSDDYIASVTYNLWQRAGCPAGQEMEFWEEAERLVAAMRQAESKPVIQTRFFLRARTTRRVIG